MATKIIAILSLTAISIGCTFGNYWLTFGLWPRSWGWFTFFAVVSMMNGAAISYVIKAEE